MTADWKKYIQVNIYGRTLQELHKEALETLLNGIGCSKVWIGEGSVYGGDSTCTDSRSESSDDDDDPEPLLSTTVATSGLPRFSTPRTSRYVTMNFPVNISRIDNSDEDQIDKKSVSSGTIQFEPSEVSTINREESKSVILSTTMATSGGPRFSTPRTSRHFTMNFTTNISRIHSEEDRIDGKSVSSGTIQYEPSEVSTVNRDEIESVVKSVVDKLLDRVERDIEHREWKSCELTRSATAQPTKSVQKKNKRRRSAPEGKMPILAGDSDHEQFKYSKFLKRRPSEERCYETKTVCDSQTRNLNAQVGDSVSANEHSTIPRIHSPMASIDWDQPIAYSYDQDGSIGEDAVGGDEFFSMNDEPGFSNYDTTLDIETFTPPPPNVLPAASILRQHGKSGNPKKTVSFRSPKKRANGKKSEDNKLHVIKCEYPGCQREIAWKLKYGKLRLIDHALTHSTEKLLGCRSCDFACVTIRQMRYHYEKQHNKKKMEGFGMLDMPSDKMDLRSVWNCCYKANLEVVGAVGRKRILLRYDDQRKDKTAREPSAVGNEEEQDGNTFHFRRIC